MRTDHVRRAALVASLALFAGRADAHQNSIASLDLAADGRTVQGHVRIDASDLAVPLGLSPLLVPTRAQALANAPHGARYVAAHLHVRNAGETCAPDVGPPVAHDAAAGFELVYPVVFACERRIETLALTYDLLFEIDPRHRGVLQFTADGASREVVFRDDARTFTAGAPATVASRLREYLVLGIEHIFTGYDHLAFLFTLLLAAGAMGIRRGLRHALSVVTAFTLAHSITLIGAALGLVSLPSQWVEVAIAASIAYVALENLHVREPRGRFVLVFAFGLVHGLGFASVLRDLGLPAHGLVPSLVAFNVGVELGQLTMVALALPALWSLAHDVLRVREYATVCASALVASLVLWRAGIDPRVLVAVAGGGTLALVIAVRALGYRRGARVGASLVIAGFAALWMVERITAHTWLGGVLG